MKKLLLLLALALFLFTWKIGSTPILDGDTGFWASIAKNMVQTNNWLTPHYPGSPAIIDRPPLMPWMIAISFKLFGVNEFALSFWHSLVALGVVIFTFLLGKELYGKKTAWLSTIILLTSAQFFYQSRSPLQDMPLTFFTLLTIFFFVKYDKLFMKAGLRNPAFIGLAAFFCGLGVLTKGPVGLILPGMAITLYMIFKRKLVNHPNGQVLARVLPAGLLFLAVVLPWYIAEYKVLGTPFAQAVVGNNLGRFFTPVDLVGKITEASKIAPQYDFYAYFVQLLLLLVPWSAFFYPALFVLIKKEHAQNNTLLCLCYAAAVILFFSFSLNYKISRYILPAYPALALIIGRFWTLYLERPEEYRKPMIFSNLLNIALIIPALFAGTIYLIYAFPVEQAAYQPILLPVLAILSAGMLLASFTLFLKKNYLAFALFAFSALLAYLVLIPSVDCYFPQANPTKYYALKLNQIALPKDLVINYKTDAHHQMNFYLNKPMLVINSVPELQAMLKNKKKMYIMAEGELKIPGLKILEKRGSYILYTNNR